MRKGWNVGVLFPQMKPLEDNPKARRLQLMRTLFNKPKCRCGKAAHFVIPASGLHWCQKHLPPDDRRRLSLDYQWRTAILPLIDAHARGIRA